MSAPSRYGENPTRRPTEARQRVLTPGEKTPEEVRAETITRRKFLGDVLQGIRDVAAYGVSRKIFGSGNSDGVKQDPDAKIEPISRVEKK